MQGLVLQLIRASACAILLALAGCSKKAPTSGTDDFIRLMNTGKNYLDQGQATRALENFQKAAQIVPNDPDVHLNLANSHLLAGNAEAAIKEADEVLKLDANSAAAHFVKGSALLRLTRNEEALKSFQDARQVDVSEPALSFQLGLAHFNLKQWEEAITAFEETLALNPQHPAAHYNLAQALLRAGRQDEAQAELDAHQKIAAQSGGAPLTPATFEKSKFTQARVPFKLEQPASDGVKVTFADATSAVFGDSAATYSGPFAIFDPNHTGTNSLFVLNKQQGFQLLWNNNGKFEATDEPYPHNPQATYTKMLVGDLQNDNNRYDDIVVLGDKGAHIFKFATNGFAMDVSPFSRLQGLAAIDGALVDLDFTGTLDLLVVTAETNDVRLFRQSGPFLFTNITASAGIPDLKNAASVLVDDWNKDEMMDVFIATKAGPLRALTKQRGGPLISSNAPALPSGAVFATGDLDNDLRTDLAVVSAGKIEIFFNGGVKKEIPLSTSNVKLLKLVDYDNDGWLDLWAAGDRLLAWRNTGLAGFVNQSVPLALDKISGSVSWLDFADFDQDCDSDIILGLTGGGLKFLRNDGGNGNKQVKVRLLGNRSNASGLGCKIELSSGGLRLTRTVQQLPVEIGVGKNEKMESMIVHWFNLALPSFDVPVECQNQLIALEITIAEGSCPFLYAWNGQQFEFVTDLLGAAPLGLPVAEGRIIESDPDEFVLIGREEQFPPRDGFYQVQITEELREILYLDEAKLVVADLEPGTEVVPSDKLLPGQPFPPSELFTFHREQPLRKATTLSGRDVTDLLAKTDTRRVSPDALRSPQLRGLAEPHGVILDFGRLDISRPLALVLNGWLRFGGGMANINASHDPSLPSPFPILEAKTSDGKWHKVDTQLGAPAGKTKILFADLRGKLPSGTEQLRLQAAFEIHWDRIALLEFKSDARTRLTHLYPDVADLHYRGFSEFKYLSWDWPLTPDYAKVGPRPFWRITPAGWCTRFGDVRELIMQRDEGMVIMNGGDELTLKFAADKLPPKPPGTERHFFLYTDGWDKDADFHVVTGTTVEPIPHHGLDDQTYGKVPRPNFPTDELHQKYNTRWVGPLILRPTALAK